MSTQIADFSPFFTELYEQVATLSEQDSLFKWECTQAADAFEVEADDLQRVLEVAHKAQRLVRIFQAGIENNSQFHEKLDELDLPSWSDLESINVAPEMQEALADKLYNVSSPEKDIVALELGDKSKYIAEVLLKRLMQDNVKFTINFNDTDFTNLLLSHAGDAGIENLAKGMVARILPATKRIVVMTLMPEHAPLVDKESVRKESRDLYAKGIQPIREKSSRGEMETTLTFIPTRAEALIDKIDYNEYLRVFFEMSNQPWQRISDAHKFLIEQFNRASHARFTNDWGTDVSMELVDHEGRPFTFCNSLIAKNVPGSEVFSAPRKDSVNGRIVSRGRFCHDDSNVIENLTLHFTKGCLDLWGAEKGVEHFDKFIENDPGNRYVGELGIGTNPHLKQHVVNGLLVEKIGGSFHLALGGAYEMTDYLGEPVYVDNGNRSKDHWDITTMLHGAGGCIYLDGRKIMDNGVFVDRRLDVLNRGWLAVPEAQRPEYWKHHPTPFKAMV